MPHTWYQRLTGVYSKKTTTLQVMSTKNYHFFNLSKNYNKIGSLFQKNLVAEQLDFKRAYDTEGPRVRYDVA